MSNDYSLVNDYLSFLKSRFRVERTPIGYTVCTPYMRPDNDPLVVQVIEKGNGQLTFSDGGRVIEYLFLAGAELETSPRRMELAEEILANVSATLSNGQIIREASLGGEAEAFHNIVRAMLDVYSLVHAALPRPLLARRAPLGPRVHSVLRKDFDYWRIWRVMREGETIIGSIPWIIDFSYVPSHRVSKVMIATVDLRVKEPLEKAKHLSAQWADLRRVHSSMEGTAVFRRPDANGDYERAETLIRALSDVSFDYDREKQKIRDKVIEDIPRVPEQQYRFGE